MGSRLSVVVGDETTVLLKCLCCCCCCCLKCDIHCMYSRLRAGPRITPGGKKGQQLQLVRDQLGNINPHKTSFIEKIPDWIHLSNGLEVRVLWEAKSTDVTAVGPQATWEPSYSMKKHVYDHHHS